MLIVFDMYLRFLCSACFSNPSVVHVWRGMPHSTSPDCAEFQTYRGIPSVLGKRKKMFWTHLLLWESVKALHLDGMKRLPKIFLWITYSVTEILGGVLISFLPWSTALKGKRAAVIPACGEKTMEESRPQGNQLPKDLSFELAGRRQSRMLQVALRTAVKRAQVRRVAYLKA